MFPHLDTSGTYTANITQFKLALFRMMKKMTKYQSKTEFYVVEKIHPRVVGLMEDEAAI